MWRLVEKGYKCVCHRSVSKVLDWLNNFHNDLVEASDESGGNAESGSEGMSGANGEEGESGSVETSRKYVPNRSKR